MFFSMNSLRPLNMLAATGDSTEDWDVNLNDSRALTSTDTGQY